MKNTIPMNFEAEYASEVLETIPAGYINKKICGVGLTTVALQNKENTIVLVPGIELIRNKVAQYPNKYCNYTIFGVFGETNSDNLQKYLDTRGSNPIKIMCTYDSIFKIEKLLPFCHLIIDESNKLLASSSLKSTSKRTARSVDVTTNVFNVAEQYKDTVSFISATPTPIEFLPTWVSEIDYIEMTWSNTVKVKPVLLERTYPYKSLVSEILEPLKNNIEITLGNASLKKAIIFMNSVENIVMAIKNADIDKKDIAIIAGNSVENDAKIKGYNRLLDPHNLPKFTFITSTGFEGIDLYDEEAISIVVSNTNKAYQMIDITSDLKQAISRQRTKSNVNFDKFIYIYNQSVFSKSTEELQAELEVKKQSIIEAIYLWEVAKKENKRSGFIYTEDNKDFIAYTNYLEETEEYVLNENLFNADMYFILNIKEQYRNGFDIAGRLSIDTESDIIAKPQIVDDLSYIDIVERVNAGESIENFKHKGAYYELIKNCQALYGKVWVNQSYAKSMIENYGNEYGRIVLTIRNEFKAGQKYTCTFIKEKLQDIYNEYELNRIAKATDLQEFMQISSTLIKIGYSRVKGFYVVSYSIINK